MIEFVREIETKPQATVLGTNVKTDVQYATLANGLIGHALDFDDYYHGETVIHGTAVCLPGLLSIAESRKLGGEEILAALVLAFDVAVRIGLGLGSYHYERGWHATSTAGVFGAVTGAAKLLKLDVDKIVQAFGICGTQASGLRQVFGTMCKPFHAGKAAMDGVMSAFLAEKGFTSSTEIIEGELGILQVLTDYPDQDRITEGLGSRYHISDVSFKPYPTCA